MCDADNSIKNKSLKHHVSYVSRQRSGVSSNNHVSFVQVISLSAVHMARLQEDRTDEPDHVVNTKQTLTA